MSENALTMPMMANLQVVAETPQEMAQAQKFIIDWCDRRKAIIQQERSEAEENYLIAQKAKWRSSSWKSAMNRCDRRIMFYEKVKAACQAGYYIIPPFWGQIFAVRTKRDKPTKRTAVNRRDLEQSHQTLPVGEGHYINTVPKFIPEGTAIETNYQGKEREVTLWSASEFQEVEFPVALIKPAVLKATQQAMAAKIFDRMSLISTQGDPIIAGQIYNPARSYDFVTFHVAWWLDLERL